MPASTSPSDPLTELALALREGNTLPWVLAYHRAGAPDPIQAAWATTSDGTAMREILGVADPARLAGAIPALEAHWHTPDHAIAIGDSFACCAAVMRNAVPIGPTLIALFSALGVPHEGEPRG